MRIYMVVFMCGAMFFCAVEADAQSESVSDTLNAVAISPDGKLLASGSSNKTVSVWDFETGALLHTLKGHTESVNSVGFSVFPSENW